MKVKIKKQGCKLSLEFQGIDEGVGMINSDGDNTC